MLSDERLRELWKAHGQPGTNWRDWAESFARAVEAEARREALEEAAALAIERTKKYTDFSTNWHVAADCAAAIRALKEKP